MKPVANVDASLRMTGKTIGTPIAAILPDGAGEREALDAFAAGARFLEMGDVAAAVRAAIVLDLVRGKLPEDASFDVAQIVVRLPAARADAEAVLDAVAGSSDERWSHAMHMNAEDANRLGTTRPVTAVTLATALDEAGEAFATAIYRDWGDDLVLALPLDARPDSVAPALDRLRAVAESCGCTLAIRVPASASAPLLSALATSAAHGMPVWLDGVEDAPSALARGASLVSGRDPRALWSAFAARASACGARRASDLVLFGVAPDDAIRACAEQQFGKDTWLTAPVKNAVLALLRLTQTRGGTLDSPLVREALANPPKVCCLYEGDEPDLKDAATGWTYDLWVRETMRRRLPVG